MYILPAHTASPALVIAGWPKYMETWNFVQKSWKNLEFFKICIFNNFDIINKQI